MDHFERGLRLPFVDALIFARVSALGGPYVRVRLNSNVLSRCAARRFGVHALAPEAPLLAFCSGVGFQLLFWLPLIFALMASGVLRCAVRAIFSSGVKFAHRFLVVVDRAFFVLAASLRPLSDLLILDLCSFARALPLNIFLLSSAWPGFGLPSVLPACLHVLYPSPPNGSSKSNHTCSLFKRHCVAHLSKIANSNTEPPYLFQDLCKCLLWCRFKFKSRLCSFHLFLMFTDEPMYILPFCLFLMTYTPEVFIRIIITP